MYYKLRKNPKQFYHNWPVLVGLTAVFAVSLGGHCGAQDLQSLVAFTRAQDAGPTELAVLDEINAARADPRAYARGLRGDLALFRGLVFDAPGAAPLMTAEGRSAVEEAIADLERRAPLPPLRPDTAIAQAALRLVADEGPSGRVGHVGSDGATLRQRFESAGVWAMKMEEVISYGPSDPREIVRELIVDDGVPDRGHRSAIFDPNISRAGLAWGPHSAWRWICVVDFAGTIVRTSGSRDVGR